MQNIMQKQLLRYLLLTLLVRSTPLELNTLAHTKLKSICINKNYTIYDGDGTDPSGIWKPEKSLLLLGISFSEACELGLYFQQNAILFAAEIPTPRLIFL